MKKIINNIVNIFKDIYEGVKLSNKIKYGYYR